MKCFLRKDFSHSIRIAWKSPQTLAISAMEKMGNFRAHTQKTINFFPFGMSYVKDKVLLNLVARSFRGGTGGSNITSSEGVATTPFSFVESGGSCSPQGIRPGAWLPRPYSGRLGKWGSSAHAMWGAAVTVTLAAAFPPLNFSLLQGQASQGFVQLAAEIEGGKPYESSGGAPHMAWGLEPFFPSMKEQGQGSRAPRPMPYGELPPPLPPPHFSSQPEWSLVVPGQPTTAVERLETDGDHWCTNVVFFGGVEKLGTGRHADNAQGCCPSPMSTALVLLKMRSMKILCKTIYSIK